MTNNVYIIDEAENGFGRCLVLTAPWSDCLIDIIKKENISVLRLAESMGWKETDVSFLEKLKGIGLRGVEIYAWDVKDVTPLQFIPSLEYLGLQCKFTKAPDFSTLENLTHLFISWRPKAKTIFDCSGLELLNVVNYPAVALQNLKKMTGLKRLQLTSRKLQSLAGIELLQSLRVLDLAECFMLESLSGIELCQKLRTVELENCKKVNDVSCLGELASLKSVVLTDCGKIRSLRPLAKCRLLESVAFVGDTNIEDGVLAPLLDLPELKRMLFADKRHYSHKRDQIKLYLDLIDKTVEQ